MTRVPIRWKLTAWYAVFFSLALLLLAGGLYLGLRDRLYESLDEQVETQGELVQAAIRIEGGAPLLAGEPALLDDDAVVRLLAPDGEVLAQGDEEVDEDSLPSGFLADALGGKATVATVQADGEPARLLTMPVAPDDEVIGVLQVGLPAEDVDETLGEVVSLLMVGVPVVLALGAAGGYLLAGRALAPVATISRLASRVNEHDLSARLELDLPNDELGRLARTFDRMLTRIEDAFERQRRFTGDAAHELRTPLGLMRSQVDLALARPRSAEEYRAALEGLDADLERLARLVGALLTLARADAGRLTREVGQFELADTVADVLEQYAPLTDAAGVVLQNEASPATIVADEGLLIQVLVTLLDNAIAHTPAGGRVTVGCRMERDQARLWVVDTGPGVAPEHRERIFDRFYRVDAGRVREAGGSGLGLAITKAIINAHGGTISVADHDGPGARLELALPADRPRHASS